MKQFLLILFLIFITRMSLALNVMPAKMILSQRVGEEKEYHFLIKNTREIPINVKVSVRDFDIAINGNISITERETLPNWIRMHTKEVRISPNALKTISFTITLSTDATGEKRAMFYFQETAEKKGAVGIVMSLASAVYCVSEGTEKIEGKVTDFKIFPKKVEVTFQNSGNVHLRPLIKLRIEDEQSEVVKEIILTQSFPILPSCEWVIKKKINELKVGNYLAIIQTRYGVIYDEEIYQVEEFPFGIFKVE